MSDARADARIVIFRLGSLGDTVVALPCFHRIAQAFPDAERLVLTNVPVSSKAAALEVILTPSGLIHGAIAYPVGLRSLAGLWRLRATLRATGARTLVYLSPVRPAAAIRRDRLFFRLCGFRRIIGLPLTEDVRVPRIAGDGTVEPEAERLARTVSELGPIDLGDRSGWDLRLTAAERAVGAAAVAGLGEGRRLFAINLGGKAVEKDWGDANWRALLAALTPTLGDHALIAVGGAEDAERSAAVLAEWPGPVRNLCGALAPRGGAAALAHAAFLIGHDSGPLHLAAAMGTPTIGLFGGYNRPRQWHPYGPGHRPVHVMGGMTDIAVAAVRDAVLAVAADAAAAAGAARA